jgi:hypothetical protein
MDHAPEQGMTFARHTCDPALLARYRRIRSATLAGIDPPPQDMPLGICDQRTIDMGDWVASKAAEPGTTETFDNFTSIYGPGQRWHYFSDLVPDEMILFKAWDNDPGGRLGCLHGAFRNMDAPAETVPRSVWKSAASVSLKADFAVASIDSDTECSRAAARGGHRLRSRLLAVDPDGERPALDTKSTPSPGDVEFGCRPCLKAPDDMRRKESV